MPEPTAIPFWIEHLAVAVCAVTGVLGAAGRRMDLFGVLVLALVTSVGGGTIRDLCLGAQPVFWIQQPAYVITAISVALGTFVIARFWSLPRRVLLVADACGLALFTIVGAEKALLFQHSAIIVVILGVITGVAGGVIRDVLCQQVPLVFRQETYLYATAACFGAVALVLLRQYAPSFQFAGLVSMSIILVLRLMAIVRKWHLPLFETRP